MTAATALAAYLGLVRVLRWRRYEAVHRKYAHLLAKGSRVRTETVNTLTPAEAQEIVQLSLGYDMHYLMVQALSFALFKTYGIPSISKLLLSTKQLTTRENISRRIADTGLMIGSWTSCPINGRYPSSAKEEGSSRAKECPSGMAKEGCDPRAMISIARMNWIHSKYDISNDDFLYTLSLFLFEPLTWAEKYGWRPCAELEKYAWFVYWVEIGKLMDIKDIPPTFDELKTWSEAYEEKHMVPATSNYEVARHTTDEMLFHLPEVFGIKDFEPQPWYMHALLRTLLGFMAFVQKHLLLPRRTMGSLIALDLPAINANTGKVERTHPPWFQPRPWYMPDPGNWLEALGMRVALWAGWYECAPGPRWKSEGYYLDEMKFEKEGQEEVLKEAERLLGCPIPSQWWRKGKAEEKMN
ncbi:hypothetical protein K525DRAFT_251946 [Schizophyllum commune Loenen D]|nr:hypothetical protein K525DRAFT_251946 [Schizophyllum commune Loenen D]